MNTRNLWSLTVVLISGMSLAGCDWVDSTGAQSAPVVMTEVFLDDTRAGDVNVLNEKSMTRIITTRSNSTSLEQTFTWSEDPLEQGNLDVCANQDGFKPEFSASTLTEACKAGVDCELEFVMVDSDLDSDVAEFDLEVPVLDASVGVRYELSVEDSSGRVSTPLEFTFCLIAINEAPIAIDDTFSITEGDTLNITPFVDNLLTNDYDDTDVSNTEFTIVTEPLVAPMHAAFFELSNDGSFTYQSNLSNLREDALDTFTYQLWDGLSLSQAIATIRVVAGNQAPRLIAPISILPATEGVRYSTDLSTSFFDPEGGTMTFSLSALTPLVAGTGLSLSTTGILSGIPTAADVGSYEFILVVSDGGLTTDEPFSLEVAAAPIVVVNRSPLFVAGSVSNRSVRRLLTMVPIRPEFTDADNDTLTYAMAGTSALPVGVSINTATGVISGVPRIAGSYLNLRVRATDPDGATAVSGLFTITVTSN